MIFIYSGTQKMSPTKTFLENLLEDICYPNEKII
jgi:hypothetical protein